MIQSEGEAICFCLCIYVDVIESLSLSPCFNDVKPMEVLQRTFTRLKVTHVTLLLVCCSSLQSERDDGMTFSRTTSLCRGCPISADRLTL